LTAGLSVKHPPTCGNASCPSRKACFSNELEKHSLFVFRFWLLAEVSSVFVFLLSIADLSANHPPTCGNASCPNREICFINELETIFVFRFLILTKFFSVLTFLLLEMDLSVNNKKKEAFWVVRFKIPVKK
jgi:hypothetical protein